MVQAKRLYLSKESGVSKLYLNFKQMLKKVRLLIQVGYMFQSFLLSLTLKELNKLTGLILKRKRIASRKYVEL